MDFLFYLWDLTTFPLVQLDNNKNVVLKSEFSYTCETTEK